MDINIILIYVSKEEYNSLPRGEGDGGSHVRLTLLGRPCSDPGRRGSDPAERTERPETTWLVT